MQELLIVNPRKRGGKKRHKSVKRSSARRRTNPIRYAKKRVMRRRSRRRNPIAVSTSGLFNMLAPALWGGGGAVATDIAYRMLPVPGALSILKGTLAPVTRIGVAFGVASLAKMIVGQSKARDILSGSLAVIAYGMVNNLVLSRLPVAASPVNGYELSYGNAGAVVQGTGHNAALPDMSSLNEYIPEYSGVGEYIG